MNKHSVLVCDDSDLFRYQFVHALESEPMITLLEAKDGNEAVEMYHTHVPSLVFMDIVMPNKDGIQALKEIVRTHPDASIIMMSSSNQHAHLRRSVHLGAKSFVQKPMLPHTIKELLEEYIYQTS
ncbi:response regulator [Paenalkalicoccus suaedae]|uniref:Response regulator n=1 Tax=Paenalkalicoccus suaedae TaxID=2592382 RepID=A0A859FDK8_9BACI|nr:response regulator [Paenalkalicoccus suaedae]QKS70664.1 response regulator [Paenalkalicoccus suaedae]